MAGTVSRRSGAEPRDELGEAELVEARGGVDQHVAVGAEPGEDVDLVQQRRVLDDQRVRLGDRLARADRLVVDAAERHHRRAHPLRAEARERLGVPALEERGRREQLGRGDDALAAAAVEPHLEHRRVLRVFVSYRSGTSGRRGGRAGRRPWLMAFPRAVMRP